MRYDYKSQVYHGSSSTMATGSYKYKLQSIKKEVNNRLALSIDKDNGVLVNGHLLKDGWHMLSLTFSDEYDYVTIYSDGEEVGSFAATGTELEAIRHSDIWKVYASSTDMIIDEIYYFTNCLSSAQVARIDELEKPKCIVDHTVVQGTVEPSVSKDRVDFAALGGSGEVDVTVAQRVGKIIVSGKEYTITQICSLLVTTETDGHGSITGGDRT